MCCDSKIMFVVVWISFVGLFYSGSALTHHARHERTRYVSSRNQIYGRDFDANEKYIPFVHFWEKPLQILESSMKIPKKLSSRPLFSWDIPIQLSTYTPSRKSPTTEKTIKPVPETLSRDPGPPNTDTKAILHMTQTVQKSRSDRAKASVLYPDSFDFIPKKVKKSGNRKKSIEESEKWKEFTAGNKTSVKLEANGKLRRKKLRKSRKGKPKKAGKRRKNSTVERAKEMNDQVNEVPGYLNKIVLGEGAGEARPPCEALEETCEHRCKEVNGTGVCVCFRGFTLEGNKCVDINECETNNGGCNGKCINTIGSRECICSAGFRLVDGTCADINECLLRNGHGPCQDQCTNTVGSYYCGCDNLPGTSLSSDRHTCEATGGCNITSAGCSHSCLELSGRAFCTCPDGLELGSDWKTCHDIDECSNPEDYDVLCEFGCVNTIGSYICATRNETSS